MSVVLGLGLTTPFRAVAKRGLGFTTLGGEVSGEGGCDVTFS